MNRIDAGELAAALPAANLAVLVAAVAHLSGDLSGLADSDVDFKLPAGRGDEFAHGSPGSPDSRDRAPAPRPRDIFIPLCRVRHKSAYAEFRIMPTAAVNALVSELTGLDRSA